jgi:hypothetical protein
MRGRGDARGCDGSAEETVRWRESFHLKVIAGAVGFKREAGQFAVEIVDEAPGRLGNRSHVLGIKLSGMILGFRVV